MNQTKPNLALGGTIKTMQSLSIFSFIFFQINSAIYRVERNPCGDDNLLLYYLSTIGCTCIN